MRVERLSGSRTEKSGTIRVIIAIAIVIHYFSERALSPPTQARAMMTPPSQCQNRSLPGPEPLFAPAGSAGVGLSRG